MKWNDGVRIRVKQSALLHICVGHLFFTNEVWWKIHGGIAVSSPVG
jgi:hypothetical protein